MNEEIQPGLLNGFSRRRTFSSKCLSPRYFIIHFFTLDFIHFFTLDFIHRQIKL
jgi:hypothetical protein